MSTHQATLDTEKTEQRLEQYLETARYGFDLVSPVFVVAIGLALVVVAIPFFLIGIMARTTVRLSRFVLTFTPDPVKRYFRALILFQMTHMMDICPMPEIAPRERQTHLSEYED